MKKEYPGEWLLFLEMLELLWDADGQEDTTKEVSDYLLEMKHIHPELENLLDNGLAMISERITGIQATP